MARPRIDYTHCIDCNNELNTSNILYSRDRPRSRCKDCYNKNECERRKQNPSVFKDAQLKYRYGSSLEEYNRLFNLQNGVCAICKQSGSEDKDLAIDHNHVTNEIRGLLCQTCNQAIGFLREDPTIILNAYEYLSVTTWNKGLDKVWFHGRKGTDTTESN